MKYISLNWTLALKIFSWKEKENARLPNTYGARLFSVLCILYGVTLYFILHVVLCILGSTIILLVNIGSILDHLDISGCLKMLYNSHITTFIIHSNCKSNQGNQIVIERQYNGRKN